MRDDFLKCVAMCLCALSAMWSLAVFAFELRLRNIRRVTMLASQDDDESAAVTEALATIKRGLEVLPDSPEINTTMQRVNSALSPLP